MNWLLLCLLIGGVFVMSGCTEENFWPMEKCPPNAYCETFNTLNYSTVTYNLTDINVSTYHVVLA